MVIRTGIAAARARRRLEPAQMAFGLLALTLHLALLWVPLDRDLHRPVISSGSVIEVSLARPPDEAMEAPMTEASAPPTTAPPANGTATVGARKGRADRSDRPA